VKAEPAKKSRAAKRLTGYFDPCLCVTIETKVETSNSQSLCAGRYDEWIDFGRTSDTDLAFISSV
jgi:hypothetical protein